MSCQIRSFHTNTRQCQVIPHETLLISDRSTQNLIGFRALHHTGSLHPEPQPLWLHRSRSVSLSPSVSASLSLCVSLSLSPSAAAESACVVHAAHRCRANSAHTRQPRPDAGRGLSHLQNEILKIIQVVPSSQASGGSKHSITLQGDLAHEKRPPPYDPPTTLGVGLR